MFKFELGQTVKLNMSNEAGIVIGQAKNLYMPVQYCVEYVAGDGRQVTNWFFVEQLIAAE